MSRRQPPWGIRSLQELPPVEGDGVVVVSGSELQMTPVKWLWRFWLAMGKLHLLAGEPGQGKTTIAIALAATVTTGGRFPDGATCAPGSVLIWSGEDDPADTLKPRLIAAGADISRVHFITGTMVGGRSSAFDPARDMAALITEATALRDVRLLIMDPIVSAVTGDSHKNTEVRRSLQPLVDWAATTGAAILGITHFSKGGKGQDPTQRVVGSVAFAAVARVVLVAAKVSSETGEERRILARSKSNIGPDGDGVEYHIEQFVVEPGIEASRIAWGAAVKGSARQLLEPPELESKGTAQDAAGEFLSEFLGDDVVPFNKIEQAAKAEAHSIKTLRRAAQALGVIKQKGGIKDGWYWKLPRTAAKVANLLNMPNTQEWASSESWASSGPAGTEPEAAGSESASGPPVFNQDGPAPLPTDPRGDRILDLTEDVAFDETVVAIAEEVEHEDEYEPGQ